MATTRALEAMLRAGRHAEPTYRFALPNCATSVCDAVDGSSSSTRVPWIWGLSGLPQSEGTTHASGHGSGTLRSRSFRFTGLMLSGQVVIRRRLKRRYVLSFFEKLPPCLVGIEACVSSHHWSRELQALGHTMRLMPPAHLNPYVKLQKNDTTDAEAMCEAVTRPNMRFEPTKTLAQPEGNGARSMEIE